MFNLQKLSVAAIATAAVLAGANSANAFTITSSPVPFGTHITSTFDDGLRPNGYTGGEVVSGTVINDHAQPLNDFTPYLTVAPSNRSVAGNSDIVTIALDSVKNYFSLYWGSIDPQNQIKFFLNDKQVGFDDGFYGSSIPGTNATSSHTLPTDNLYVQFSGTNFNKVQLITNNKIAFESDNHTFKSVPEPASIVGLLVFGALGAGSLVKRTSKVA
jgi:hypothetical protein